MPPKEKLGRQDVIRGAVELVRECGFDALNARALAQRLGCSTMPLFRHFKGMDEIRRAVFERIVEIYAAYIRRGAEQEIPFKAVGMEYIRFAKEEPNLFRLMFMTDPHSLPMMPPEDPTHQQVSSLASRASGLRGELAETVYREMWIFVHGIATLIVTGVMDFQEAEISTMLTDVFQGLRRKMNQQQEDINHE